jgi:hypothetical protein
MTRNLDYYRAKWKKIIIYWSVRNMQTQRFYSGLGFSRLLILHIEALSNNSPRAANKAAIHSVNEEWAIHFNMDVIVGPSPCVSSKSPRSLGKE